MKKLSLVSKFFIGLAAASALSTSLLAAPSFINYQGKLTDVTGNPVSNQTPIPVTFRFYLDLSGEKPIWFNDQTITPTNGVFSTKIPVPNDLFKNHDTVYLAVVLGSSELSPRQQLVAAPYALAVNAENIIPGNLPSSVIVSALTAGAVDTAQIKDGAVKSAKIESLDASKLTGVLPAALDASKLTGVTASVVAADAVDTAQIKDGAVKSAKIESLDASKLTGALPATLDASNLTGVTASVVAAGAVDTAQIKDGAVTSQKLADGTIAYNKLNLSHQIQNTDMNTSSLSNVYETNDGRLILGKDYKSSMCGVSDAAALFYNCDYGPTRSCDQTSPGDCSASQIAGHLISASGGK